MYYAVPNYHITDPPLSHQPCSPNGIADGKPAEDNGGVYQPAVHTSGSFFQDETMLPKVQPYRQAIDGK